MASVEIPVIERSIIKKYRKFLWAKFIKAVLDYQMLSDGDKVAVAISGGKDSLLLAKLFQELKRINLIKFELEFISMNPGFSNENLQKLKENCEIIGIPVKIFDSDIFKVAEKVSAEHPCYLCARMRRGFLYRTAKDLGCNKLALGHHFNDVIETTMLNILYAGNFKTMVPKVKSTNFEGITLIRPMYLIKEEDIKRFTASAGITTMNCGCEVAAGNISSKRKEVKDLIANLKKTHDEVDACIFASAENVNLEAINGYFAKDKKYKFTDIFNEGDD